VLALDVLERAPRLRAELATLLRCERSGVGVRERLHLRIREDVPDDETGRV
jgi:hypothetical protein